MFTRHRRQNISKKEMPKTSGRKSNTESESAQLEDCVICCESYEDVEEHWEVLHCDHKICSNCFKKIKITRQTMSGIEHTSVKCPFCQITTGIVVGTCPTGTMDVTLERSSCDGYEEFGTIRIRYFINNGQYFLNRTAYLPNNVEGNEILGLLKIAWDRRVCFTIGTSVTTGQENTVVWNIHHKTNKTGGVHFFGYPDPSYLQRVRLELEANGIVANPNAE